MKTKRNLWIRRTLSLTILAILATSIISFASEKIGTSISKANASQETAYLAHHQKVQVVIQNGDTAWGIQSKLAPGEDVRYNLYLDSQLSGQNMGDVKPGEVVTFLKRT